MMSDAAINTRSHDETEFERVVNWRLRELMRAGYDWKAALMLAARSHVDLHLAVGLARRGCPPDTALRILL